MTPDFDRAHYEATELLLKQSLNSLRVDVRNFKFDKSIRIDSIQNYAKLTYKSVDDFWCDEISGCCVLGVDHSGYLILYDDSEQNQRRKHWGVAHEVGHIYLKHKYDDDTSEIEAHFFAAQIVTPEIALIECAKRQGGQLYAEQISSRFNISQEAAARRINTLARRGCYSRNPEDLELLRKLTPLIDAQFPNQFVV